MGRKSAFTLAEVLITLGVIGVVAALTMSTLIAKHNKSVIETGIKKTYSELDQAFKRSEIDNGDFKDWDFTLSTDEFVKVYIAPYLKLKRCNATFTGCFVAETPSSNMRTWYYPNGVTKETGGIYRINPAYQMQDGRAIKFVLVDYVSNQKWLNMVVDVDGPRGRTMLNRDVFMFYKTNSAGYGVSSKIEKISTWEKVKMVVLFGG